MKPIGFIYLTTNLVNGKIYIGRSEFSENKRHNAIYLGSGHKFKNALKKYGRENFKRKILRLCFTEHELTIWEHVYIKKYHSQDKNIGYNIADGDVNTSDYNPAKLPEVRKKISENHAHLIGKNHPSYGKHLSEERKNIQSKIMKEKYENGEMVSPMKGKHHTEESRKKISDSLKVFFKTEKGFKLKKKIKETNETRVKMSKSSKKRKFTDEEKKHLSNILKGRKFTEEHKQKLREAKLGKKGELSNSWGRKWSEEDKKRLSNSHLGKVSGMKGKHHTEESRVKMSKSQKERFKTGVHPMKGKHHTEESKEKNRISHLEKRNSKL